MIALDKKKKYSLGAVALVVAIILVSVGVTLAAWNTDPKNETNVVTLGNVKIKLNDNYTPTYHITRDFNVSKEVSVTNTGNQNCYVRLLVRKEWDKNASGESPSTDTIIYTHLVSGANVDGYNSGAWTQSGTVTLTESGKSVTYDCYYYTETTAAGKGVLAPAKETPKLFDHFKLSTTLDITKFGGLEGRIIVKAQAVQVENFPNSDITNWSGITFA